MAEPTLGSKFGTWLPWQWCTHLPHNSNSMFWWWSGVNATLTGSLVAEADGLHIGRLHIYIYKFTDLCPVFFTFASVVSPRPVHLQYRDIAVNMPCHQFSASTSTYEPHEEYVWPSHGSLGPQEIQVGSRSSKSYELVLTWLAGNFQPCRFCLYLWYRGSDIIWAWRSSWICP